MYKIQTLNKISYKGLEQFPRDDYEIASEIVNPDAVVLRSFNMHDMDIPASVKAIARAGAGVNNIPVDKCTENGQVVFNTPGANANGVKELVLTGIFMSSRKLVPGVLWAKGLIGEGDKVPKLVEKGKSNFAGPEIRGKRLGVIGLGAIGVMVANDAIALGMEVTGYDPFISVEAAWGLSSSVKRARGLESLLAESDYITIHVPLNEKTKGMINKERFAIMKKGVRLLNFSRGGLVNNNDLIEALEENTVSTYVTDFPDEQLLKQENVIPFPHLGASTPESEDNCAVMAANQVRDYLEYGNIKNSVNFPECQMDYSGTARLIIANKNIPNMVGQITSLLATEKINIADMINKHKGELAYNIIDIDGKVGGDITGKIEAIDGVIMARLLDPR
ncbi:phosphoglycerate dehydrogenase [Chitinispirillales bacterium ANBcel5]|uniref:phosphoglycerate dehydrogenase n=1 Tax=Cellulosispirillum alkaliphilum TaxID=3039283 RepID=UPI002A57549C|nr:phosphoglycerate dehydrogenase [Chitinispirillales bacterium ANBcel5]